MSNIPDTLKYTKEHEWVKLNDDGTALVGITDHAQESLGDITFVEMPATGDELSLGETFGVVESVKAASDLYCPLSGEVLEINEDLENAPETVNNDPYEQGWMIKIKLTNEGEIAELLSADDYKAIV